jgi:hypothetical protein
MNVRDHVAQALLETEAHAIVLSDRDGVIRFCNPDATRHVTPRPRRAPL